MFNTNGKLNAKLALVLLAVASFTGGMYAEAVASRTNVAKAEAAIKHLEADVAMLQGDYATTADIARLEKQMDSLNAKMDRVLTRQR